MNFKIGDKVVVNNYGKINGNWGVGIIIDHRDPFWNVKFESLTGELAPLSDGTALCLPEEMTPVGKPVYSQKKNKKGVKHRPLYVVASKEGMTHKGLAKMVNDRKVDTFGNSVLQALSKYEDKFGRRLDLKDALVFKLVPHTIRIDKKNGKPRVGTKVN